MVTLLSSKSSQSHFLPSPGSQAQWDRDMLALDHCRTAQVLSQASLAIVIVASIERWCKENGPLAHLLWILVFDDQHNQIGLMNLQVFVL